MEVKQKGVVKHAMVTKYGGGGGSPLTFFGLSTDTKPETVAVVVGKSYGIPNGSIFYEINTGDIYMWNAEGESWIKQ